MLNRSNLQICDSISFYFDHFKKGSSSSKRISENTLGVHFFQNFQKFKIFPFQTLSSKVSQIQTELAKQITEDFHNAFLPNSTGMKMSLTQLTEACQVVSVLDPKVKADLLKWFISKKIFTNYFLEGTLL